MLQKILSNLAWKTTLAIVSAVILIQVALLWPESSQRERAARRQAYSEMMGSARADLNVKAEALAKNQYDRVKSRIAFWETSRFPSDSALIGANGDVAVSSADDVPDFKSGKLNKFLQKAFKGDPVRDSYDGQLMVLVPLQEGGELLEGQEAIGAFAVFADESRAIAALTQRRAISDFLMMALSAAFSAAAMALIVYFLFIRPIRSMERHDRQLDLNSVKISTLGQKFFPDELGELGRGRNRLLERLGQVQDQAHEINVLLQRTEAKYRALVNTIPDIVFRMDLQGNFVFLSPSIERLVGLKPETVYDSMEAFYERVMPEDREPVEQALHALAAGEKNRRLQFRMISSRANESPLQFNLYYSPELDAKGQLQAIEGIFRRTGSLEETAAVPELSPRFTILEEVSRVLHSGPLPEDIFDYAAARAGEIAGAERSVVALLDNHETHALGLFNLPEDLRQTPLPLVDTAEAKVVETRAPMALLTEEEWSAYGLESAYVGVPILDRLGQPVGLICCHGLKPERNGEALAALTLLAALILPAVESERALRHAQQVEIAEEPRRRKKKNEDLTFFQ